MVKIISGVKVQTEKKSTELLFSLGLTAMILIPAYFCDDLGARLK